MSMALNWRKAEPADLPAIAALHTRALAVDGGSPFAAADWLLRRWYVDGIDASLAAFRADELIGICARRYPGAPDGSPWKIAGQVAPGHRGHGVGARLLDFALDFALDGTGPAAPVLVETETLTPPADALFRRRGLRQSFAEDVMTMPLARRVPPAAPAGISFTEWTRAAASRFFAVWEASFRERAGFPGWPAETWIDWITDDEDFRADWTLLACAGDADLGFIVGGTGGWIAQAGVVPAARGRRISSLLIAEAHRRMAAAGETRSVLTVNVNNPSAIAVYERIGFARIGRRARYERGSVRGRES
jgi:mycothiol synthase